MLVFSDGGGGWRSAGCRVLQRFFCTSSMDGGVGLEGWCWYCPCLRTSPAVAACHPGLGVLLVLPADRSRAALPAIKSTRVRDGGVVGVDGARDSEPRQGRWPHDPAIFPRCMHVCWPGLDVATVDLLQSGRGEGGWESRRAVAMVTALEEADIWKPDLERAQLAGVARQTWRRRMVARRPMFQPMAHALLRLRRVTGNLSMPLMQTKERVPKAHVRTAQRTISVWLSEFVHSQMRGVSS